MKLFALRPLLLAIGLVILGCWSIYTVVRSSELSVPASANLHTASTSTSDAAISLSGVKVDGTSDIPADIRFDDDDDDGGNGNDDDINSGVQPPPPITAPPSQTPSCKGGEPCKPPALPNDPIKEGVKDDGASNVPTDIRFDEDGNGGSDDDDINSGVQPPPPIKPPPPSSTQTASSCKGGMLCELPAFPNHDPVKAVQGLIGRLLPSHSTSFELSVILPAISSNGSTSEVFTISPGSAVGKVALAGSSGVALASALNFYLKYTCNASITWGDDGSGLQLDLPPVLPIPVFTQITRPFKYSYYFNVCTFGYSTAFWNWERWQTEIDWMALNGINMPLSFVGQEYIWAKVYKQLGLTEDELQEWFTGPAFLPWQRMGNVRKWAGPLSASWRQAQADLNILIINRQREFGMLSVLPAFSGHVPPALSRLTPNITLGPAWGGFDKTYCCASLLEASDPLFVQIGASFVKTATAVFGTDHVYQGDTFNEMSPKTTTPAYLKSWGAAVYDGIQAADPKGVWMMQGWLFLSKFWKPDRIQAYLSGVPNNRMIILDLISQHVPIWNTTGFYFGKPFIWCTLHNYGGVRDLYGDMPGTTSKPAKALYKPGSTMAGIGLAMEAIEHNPVFYELATEMGWRSYGVNTSEWVQQYARRRYSSLIMGPAEPFVRAAWDTMHTYLYNNDRYLHSAIELVPSLKVKLHKNGTAVTIAWRNLQAALDARPSLANVGPFTYDYVDVTRQQLTNLFSELQALLATQVSTCNFTNCVPSVQAIRDTMLMLITDLDVFMASEPNFLLGRWIKRARDLAEPLEKDHLEFNARAQVTLWGKSVPRLNDYASKPWAGLIGDYYFGRWSLFFDKLLLPLQSSQRIFQSVSGFQLQFEQDLLPFEEVNVNNDSGMLLFIHKHIHCMF
eukprot:TRINITY_DN1344_c0_g1_i1.p1 TRINITY_DN1344_c0_g1~~TRINITY_DN1344_c0_g1_i1.p1  ORF type:complete len:903 (-),score=-53.28 TRINITY_DN1344_c0_g1_i1:721-3429(-)